jgi:hypothetical protein
MHHEQRVRMVEFRRGNNRTESAPMSALQRLAVAREGNA